VRKDTLKVFEVCCTVFSSSEMFYVVTFIVSLVCKQLCACVRVCVCSLDLRVKFKAVLLNLKVQHHLGCET
jgi:hypothetical protein